MIGIFWFQFNEINVGKLWLQGYLVWVMKKVGVFGVGMMGVGIVYVLVVVGIEVVFKDVLLEVVEKGKVYLVRLLDKKVVCGYLFVEKCDVFFVWIVLSVSEVDFEGCDLIIEVVFEDCVLKGKVIVEVEKYVLVDVVVVFNILILLIIGLVQVVVWLEKFIGLYFFSLVDKMLLVEIICGEKISDEILVCGFDYVLQIKKMLIVVNDSCGFFILWVFGIFINEGIVMFGEGVSVVMIDNQVCQVGMLVGLLVIFDEVFLSLMIYICNQIVCDFEVEGKVLLMYFVFVVIDLMVNEYKCLGKVVGVGFYDYLVNGRKYFWVEFKSCFEKFDV